MKSPEICKGCNKKMFKYRQFYICINKECYLEGLLKVDVKEILHGKGEVQHAI